MDVPDPRAVQSLRPILKPGGGVNFAGNRPDLELSRRMTTTAQVVDVVVIEDHPLYVEALLTLLSVALSGRRLERFRDVESAEPLLRVCPPTVILLDLMLPGLRGTDALRRVRQQCPSAIMVTISGADDPVQVSACFAAGAQAFVSKGARPQDIASVVRSAVEGRLVPPVWIGSSGALDPRGLGQVQLTDRQMEVLQLMCHGHSNKHISGVLGITEQTTKAHVSAIFRELGVFNRTQAVLVAKRRGMVSPDA